MRDFTFFKDKIILSAFLMLQMILNYFESSIDVLTEISVPEVMSFFTFLVYLISKIDEVINGVMKIKEKLTKLFKEK